ncbi:hypothetical protein SAMN05444278_103164 [Psychroflexus salarius]|uniref:Uncharacterized protein n=1 Tax=Psychroflexus salarius TaxID=1155689 RepID=A0A1M4UYS5_9FLAO|nr:hypothetical protein [Psychroflexus salarius]SHE61876.1 hypothetical protein SAMN05444278_103164 [Psychroflexus salarius]
MKNIQKILNFLNKYNYNFEYYENRRLIVVNLGFNLFSHIQISDNQEIIKISDKLEGFNGISGFIQTSIKKSMIYQTIMLLIAFIILELTKFSKYDYDYTYLLVIFITISLLWFIFYLVKSEIFKMKIENLV